MHRYISAADVPAVMTWILAGSRLVEDPLGVDRVCRDPKDDYLPALAEAQRATLVSGDADIQALRDIVKVPIMTTREYLESLG